MKRQYITAKMGIRGILLLFFFAAAGAFQFGRAQTYCTPTISNWVNTSCGMQTVIIGNLTNATGAPTYLNPYFDFTHLAATAAPNATVNLSILVGTGTAHRLGIFIDWNNDYVFAATEQMLNITTNAGTTYIGSFVVPSTQAPGAYRMRVIGDVSGALGTTPCALTNSGEVEDYTFAVSSAGVDVSAARGFNGPALAIGNNTIPVVAFNNGNAIVNTMDIGYRLNDGTPVVENLTALNLAVNAGINRNFTVPLNISTPGTYTLKVWARNPDGTGAGTNTNDTIRRVIRVEYPLNGTYTIDAAGSGPMNFASFALAMDELGTYGVSGPVVFDVAPNTYTEQVVVPTIPGASSTNTVVFDGTSPSNTILTFGNQTVTEKYTLGFRNASWVTFRDMTIRSTNTTNAFTVHFFGTMSNGNGLSNCVIDNAGGMNTTTTAVMGVAFAGGNTYTAGSLTATNNRVDSCTILGGYANISFYGFNSTNVNLGNYFRNNTMSSAYQWSMYMNLLHQATITGNTITGRTVGTLLASSVGIQLNSCNSTYPNAHNISNNIITDVGQYGIQISSSTGTVGAKALLSNNMIGGGFKNTTSAYGIFLTNSQWWNIYFNSVNVDANVTGEAAALYVTGTVNTFSVDARNNLLQITGTAALPWPVWATNNTMFSDLNYNSYYAANAPATSILYLGAPVSQAALTTSYGLNVSSQYRNVPYTGVRNLHIAAGCLNGIWLNQVPNDIDGTTRSSVPTMGADEYTSTVTNDIGIIRVTAPTSPVSIGQQNLEAVLKNFGTNTVTSAQISYTHNGKPPVTINWSGTLAPCAEIKITFTGTNQLDIVQGINNLSVYSALPNGVTDASIINDRTDFRICPGMTGTFTINPNGSGDFPSFTTAMEALSCAGMDGPVIFMVAAGTYNEQVLVKGIPGLSPTRTLTIDGGEGNAATRILTFNNSGNTNRHTLLLDNVSGVYVRNLTIRNESPVYGYAFHAMGTNMNTIEVVKCQVEIGAGAKNSNNANFAGIVFSNSTTSAQTSAIYTNIRIDSNSVDAGYFGITLCGNGAIASINNRVSRNRINNPYYYGMYLVSNFGIKVIGNDITMRAGNVNSIGIYFGSNNPTSGGHFHEIAYNKVMNAGSNGIFITSSHGYSGVKALLHHNVIGGVFSSPSAKGIFLQIANNWDVYYNSVNVDFLVTGASNAAAFFANSTLQFLTVRNNQFALTAPGLNSPSIFPIQIETATSLVCDNNNYFKYGATNVGFVRINAVTYTDATFKGGGTFNTSSYFTNPNFVSLTDLRTNNACAIGTPIAGYNTDFTGQTRNNPPTIGAYEGVSLDLSVVAINTPAGTSITGTNNVVFTVKNTGRTTITGFTAAYKVNSGTPKTQNWTGTLSPCSEVIITFSGADAYTAVSGMQGLVVYVNNLTQGADQNPKNDSMSTLFCSGAFSGTYTINQTGNSATNFKSFTALVNSLNACGMSGDVQINVEEGVYVDQVTLLTSIPGIETYKLSFDGGDPFKTILTTVTGTYTFKLDNVDNVTVKNMAIDNQNTTTGYTVWLTNGADSNTFDNCRITTAGTGTATIPYTIMGASYSTAGYWGQANVLKNSFISGGYIAVHIYGNGVGNPLVMSERNKVQNCYITGTVTYGAYIYYQSNFEFTGNRLEFPTGNNTGALIALCYSSTISNNHIYGAGAVALNLSQVSPAAGYPRSKVTNNMIGGMTSTGTVYGINAGSCYETDFQHNTVFIHAGTGSGRAFYHSTGTGNTLRNNIFHNEAPTGYAMYLNTATPFTSADYNNLYSSGQYLSYQIVGTVGVNTFDLDGVKLASPGLYLNSVSVPAEFVNKTAAQPDLHLKSTVPSPYGDKAVPVPFDIDGNPRCAIIPTIGADESNYAYPAKAQFAVSDTVYVNGPFTVINAAVSTAIMGYVWDFDNNGSVESTLKNPTHTFATTGIKQIKLKSSTCFGADSIVKSTRVITPTSAPVAEFVADRYSVDPFEEIQFTDLSTNGANGWQWEIFPNDPLTFFNPSDAVANPKVFFGTPGVYEVCLTSFNNIGSSAKRCKTAYITVKDANNLCIGNASSSAPDGMIYDSGGPNASYGINENCDFLIQPCATSINLKFSQFSLGNAGHFLRVYDGVDATAPLIGVYSSTSGLPGGSTGLTATSGAMYITWTTNNLASAAGFAAIWSSVTNTNNQATIGFSIPDSAMVREEVSFVNTSVGTDLDYEWDLDGDGFVDDFGRDPVFEYTVPGTYYASLRISDACGTNLSLIDSIVITTPVGPPVADFMADVTLATMDDTVRLFDLSTNGAYDWTYTITPNNATIVGGSDADPLIKFNALGVYTVSLTAENDNGTHSVTKTSYIRVVNICQPTVDGLVADVGINRVKLHDLDNVSGSGVRGFNNYFGDMRVGAANLDLDGTYELIVARNTTLNKMSRKAWIDYNADGDFDDAGELIGSEAASLNPIWSLTFTVPINAAEGALRMRIGVGFADSSNFACGPNFYGEIEDYRVVLSFDKTPPLIKLIGQNPVLLPIGTSYSDSGATAMDAVDGDVSANIIMTDNINHMVAGDYTVRYNVEDAAGNQAIEVTRTVRVLPDITPPVLQLSTPLIITLPLGSIYNEPGFTASDIISGNVTSSVVVDRGNYDSSVIGTYTLRYVAFDGTNNTDTQERIIHIVDITPPVIALNGANPLQLPVFSAFSDPGVIVSDNYDPMVFASITHNVNTMVLGTYEIQYLAKDASGNKSLEKRTVEVVDITAPSIEIDGPDTLVVEVHGNVVLPNVSALDNYDANPTLTRNGTFDIHTLGNYTVSYSAEDASGNTSVTLSRVISVVDRTIPVITLKGNYLVNVQRWTTFADPGIDMSDNYYSTLTVTQGGNFVNTNELGLYYITYNAVDGSGNKAVEIVRAINVVDNTTGLETAGGNLIKAYPNPTTGKVSLEISNGEFDAQDVFVNNIMGQRVMQQAVAGNSDQVMLDLGHLPAGVYFAQVRSGSQVYVVRIVVTD